MLSSKNPRISLPGGRAFDEVWASEDGEVVAFEIQTEDGGRFPFSCLTKDLSGFISGLIFVAQVASARQPRKPQPAAIQKVELTVHPIETKTFGIFEGRSPREVMLGFDLGIVQLVFAVPTKALHKLRDEVNRIARRHQPPPH